MQQHRRLAAILFTDIVGSTSIMQKNEQEALSVNKRYVAVLKEFILSHGGEILNDFGDGSLCTFHSATEAMRCAIEMQQQFQIEPKVPLRIGLHVGEIFFENGKVFLLDYCFKCTRIIFQLLKSRKELLLQFT